MNANWRDWPVTAAIALVTVVVSGLALTTGWFGDAVLGAGFIPLRFDGAPLPPEIRIVVPPLATPFTAALLHGGWTHLFLNMFMLLFCGSQVEKPLGSNGTLALYLVGAVGAAIGQYVQGPHEIEPMIGASGAISALLAAYALLYGKSRARAIGPVSANLVNAVWLALAWIGINLLMGFAGLAGMTIAVGAHIGGFLVGLALARPIFLWRYRRA
jgi:membrane associated rhomboid family serine protease